MFGKIFEQIYDSSIAEDWQTRVVFQDMIILADINGVVDRTPESLARRTNVPIEIVLKAIAALESPDPKSRSQEESGARIRRLDEHRSWGWEIVNYHRYRGIASDEQRRENTRKRTRKWRETKGLQSGDAPVTHGDAGDAMQRQKQRQKHVLPSVVVGHSPDESQKKGKPGNSMTAARTLIHYLNEKAGRRFTETAANLRLIQCRINDVEGDLDGCKKMVDRQIERWGNDPKMREYLRIETLFRASKFISYYDNRDLPVIHETDQRNNQRSAPNRNEGTFNDGDGSKYEHIGKVV